MTHISNPDIFDPDTPLAVVTGGARGIGLAIVKALLVDGFAVLIIGKRKSFDAAVLEMPDALVAYHACDLGNPHSLDTLCESLTNLQRVDVLVNNAGVNIIKPIDKVSGTDFDNLQAINVRAPYLLSQAVSGSMMRAGYGRIVNIGSIWSTLAKPGRSNYCTSKSALAGMTRGLAVDLGAAGILVNCVSPGFTLTDLTRQSLNDTEMEALAAQIPLRRMAAPEEIARLVAFLCSRDNSYMTGQNIHIDGGFSNV